MTNIVNCDTDPETLPPKEHWDPEMLPPKEHWKLYKELAECGRVCYINIETTGFGFFEDDVILVGLYDGEEYTPLMAGDNLTGENLNRFLSPFDMIVTFNGLCFDIPFLTYKFPDSDFKKFNFDLYLAGRKVGISGHLRDFEEKFHIYRPKDALVRDVFQMARLWEQYKEGNQQALTDLIHVNLEDTVNLQAVAENIYNLLLEREKEKGLCKV